MSRRKLLIVVVTVVLFSSAFAQQPKPGVPPTPSRPQRRQSQAQDQAGPQRPIFITGKVVLEDGASTPPGIRIELVLGGQVRAQEYALTDGSFSIDLSNRNSTGFVTDASVSGSESNVPGSPGTGTSGSRRLDLSGWQVRAVLPGYTSDPVMLRDRALVDDPDIGLVVLRRQGQSAGTMVSVVSLKAPGKAQRAFESALKAFAKSEPDYEKTEKELNTAIDLYPGYAAAWELMGQVRRARRDFAGADEAFRSAIRADENYISPYLYLADLEMEARRWSEAADLMAHVIEVNPYVTRAHLSNAVANYRMGRLDLAEESIRKVQAAVDAGQFPISHYVLGAIRARKGDVKSGAAEFALFLRLAPDHQYSEVARKQLDEWKQQGVLPEDPAPTAPVQP